MNNSSYPCGNRKRLLVAALCFCGAASLFAADARVPVYQMPGEVEIARSVAKPERKVLADGGTLIEFDGNAEKKIIAKGVAFNVRVKRAADGNGVSLTYLDQYGEPFEDQEKWAALAAGSPLPVSDRMFFSDGCPDIAGYGASMMVWQVTSLDYGAYQETTYSTGFSGDAEYFTHAFIANGSYTLTASLSGPMSISLRSDDTATLSVGAASCSSSLGVPGSEAGTFPDGTSSAAIAWTYENIGGPHSLNIQFVVRRR